MKKPPEEELIDVYVSIEYYLKEKIQQIAKFNGRSRNKEIRQVLKTYIENFERKHGELKVKKR